ncbi:MAG: hypothetical protein IIT45_01045, partial [Treponema sp.]|nr:hypothetical protein [Treponema sp.]
IFLRKNKSCLHPSCVECGSIFYVFLDLLFYANPLYGVSPSGSIADATATAAPPIGGRLFSF